MSIRICLGGRIGAGKTSVARLLEDQYGFQRFSFVTPIREEICSSFGVTMEELTEPGKKERYRSLLVAWGPARNVSTGDDYYWAKRLLERLPEHVDIVVDDLRRQEEFDYLRAQGQRQGPDAWPDAWVLVWLDQPKRRCLEYLRMNGVTDTRQLQETVAAVTEVSLLPYVAQRKFDIMLDAARPPVDILHDLEQCLRDLDISIDDPDRQVHRC